MKALARLDAEKLSSSLVHSFCHQLENTPFKGCFDLSYGARLAVATDNSMYQVLPEAVLFPKDTDDMVFIFKLASDPSYESLSFVFRGGGTGTNGQSLHSGVMIDCSRYMSQVLQLNVKEKWVRVQPGIVLDQLNDLLRPHGLCVGPTVSPSSRATIGGMVSTDACGQGSRCYGRMSEHVRALTMVLSNGETFTSRRANLEDCIEQAPKQGRFSDVFSEVPTLLQTHETQIKETFPQMKRFLTGYNLDHALKEDCFDLNALIAGSEGTLAGVTEIELSLLPLAKYHHLLVLAYDSFDEALAETGTLLETEPVAIETLDNHILSLAKSESSYRHAIHWLGLEPESPDLQALTVLAFSDDKKKPLKEKIEQAISLSKAPFSYCTEKPGEMAVFWELRKQAVGLLARTKGPKKPIPFIEDTAVSPENLSNYIRDLKSILEKEGVTAAMYGHADVGCLHVRPFLDLQDSKDQKKVRQITDQVMRLVESYGGVMWGEHGRGYRSRYTSQVFGHDLYQVLRKIKEVFDPQNRLNPGKIVTPFSMPDTLVDIDQDLRAFLDKEIPYKRQQENDPIMACNGNGLCFHYHPDHVMCPSFKVTQDRVHSPKGRATIFREWLRLYSRYESLGEFPKKSYSWFQKFIHTLQKSEGQPDFSVDVFEAMKGCLNCKACTTNCPAHVDIPTFKTRFLFDYYTRYLHSFRNHLMARFESLSAVFARFPRFFNLGLQNPLSTFFMTEWVGVVNTPKLSSPSLKSRLKAQHIPDFNLSALKTITQQRQPHTVLLLPDTFNAYYRADLVMTFYTLLKDLGKDVFVLPPLPSGKSAQVLGMKKRFQKEALAYSSFLSELDSFSLPIVGIDPGIVLSLKDDYPKLLGESFNCPPILLPQDYLLTEEKALSERAKIRDTQEYYLLGHCIEKSLGGQSYLSWKKIFQFSGLSLSYVPVGCCGMAGLYGHEKEHLASSHGIYQQSWDLALQNLNPKQTLATGFSCHHQVKRFGNESLQHPLSVL